MISIITDAYNLGRRLFAGFDAIRKGLARGTMTPEEAAERGAALMAEADRITTQENAKLQAAVAAYAEAGAEEPDSPEYEADYDRADDEDPPEYDHGDHVDRPDPPVPKGYRRGGPDPWDDNGL